MEEDLKSNTIIVSGSVDKSSSCFRGRKDTEKLCRDLLTEPFIFISLLSLFSSYPFVRKELI